MCKKREYGMVALFFDSGRIRSGFYGGEIFNHVVANKEICKNKRTVIVSLGDIFGDAYQDITPYLVKDDFCTVDLSNHRNYRNLDDWPFCWIMEDIDIDIALKIDEYLKNSLEGYLGMTKINLITTDKRKQFWKSLIRDFSIYKNTITVFGIEEEDFGLLQEAKENGFLVKFDRGYDVYFSRTNDLGSRGSSFVKTLTDLEIIEGKNDSDRGVLEMNFSLVKEVSVSGVFIWKAVEDINKFNFSFIDSFPYDSTIVFMSLYQASQGVERLQKIIIELLLYKKGQPMKEKEKTDELLHSHNHTALHKWITTNISTKKFSSNSLRLLKILQSFYNNARYSRYTYSKDTSMEITLMKEFGNKCNNNRYDDELKHLYGKALGEISTRYYDLIIDTAHDIGVFVYEISSESPAMIVFSSIRSRDLYEELLRINKAKKELFYWLQRKGESILPKGNDELDLEVLDFDPAMIDHYIKEVIKNNNSSSDLSDVVSQIYDEMVADDKPKWLERIKLIEYLVGESNCFIKDDLDDENQEEDIDIDE